LRLSGVIEVVAPRQDRIGVFGPGERGAVSLALEHRDWALLLDDLRPFVHAATLGISVVCSPLLVVDLYEDRRVTAAEAHKLLGALAGRGTMSPRLLELARSRLSLLH